MSQAAALLADSNGYPWNGRYIVASGNLLADFRANAAAEPQGRVQTARLYNMTDDPGVKEMLKFNLARDTLHQNLWLKAVEELQSDGLETTVAPNALFDEEYAEHATSVWHLSDGTAGAQGGWASGPQPDGQHEFGYLLDPEPLGDVASAPPPDPTIRHLRRQHGRARGPGARHRDRADGQAQEQAHPRPSLRRGGPAAPGGPPPVACHHWLPSGGTVGSVLDQTALAVIDLDTQADAARRRCPPGLRRMAALCGPAFIVSVAYVDPGNFATNMAGGASYGDMLLWVIAVANILAMFIQALSAKLGIATSQSLPAVCRDYLPRPVTLLLWAQGELVAVCTDLSEFLGGAIALNLLFGTPLVPAAIITAAVSSALLILAPRGRRRFETVITGLLGVVCAGFFTRQSWPTLSTAVRGSHRAWRARERAARGWDRRRHVMPHVIYLHSALTQDHAQQAGKRAALRASRIDILAALGVAGLVNMAMMSVAATALRGRGAASLPGIHASIGAALSGSAATAFALALLALAPSLLQRRDPGLPGHHGRLPAAQDPARCPAPDHDRTRHRSAGSRHRPRAGAHPQPGRPHGRAPVRTHPANDHDKPQERHGSTGQPPQHHRSGRHDHDRHPRAQRSAACAGLNIATRPPVHRKNT